MPFTSHAFSSLVFWADSKLLVYNVISQSMFLGVRWRTGSLQLCGPLTLFWAPVMSLDVGPLTVTLMVPNGSREHLIQLWANKWAVESPPDPGIQALCTWPLCTPWETLAFPLITAELSEPFKNWIDGMWNLIADKLRILVNLTTLLEDGIAKIRPSVSLCLWVCLWRSFMYVPCRFPIYLDIYDMWGAVKFLVPEFGLTALLLTSELYRSSLTSGNKGFTTPLALSHFCLGHILSFSF